jgi:hypothetical protein
LIFWKSTRHPGTPKNITQKLWQLCDCNHESPAFAHELCLQCPLALSCAAARPKSAEAWRQLICFFTFVFSFVLD